MLNSNTVGEILQDVKNGKERPWVKNKIKSTLVAESFFRIRLLNRAIATKNCGDFLIFAECVKDNYRKLVDANFCKDRMCPMCNWRRSRKLQSQIFKVLHAAVAEVPKMRFVFLTLTVRNVKGEDLNSTITEMLKGFKALFDLKEVDKPTLGYVRNLEVTYNAQRDDFHPHIHVLMGVKSDYFANHYISHARWVEMWNHLLKLDYEPQVHVKAVRKRNDEQVPAGMAMEIGKYIAKAEEYLHEGNEELTDRIIGTLAAALKGRRLIGFGKLFRKLHKELNLSDIEDKETDLVGGDEKNCTCPLCGTGMMNAIYKWFPGYNFYISE